MNKCIILIILCLNGSFLLYGQNPGSGNTLNFDGVNNYVNIPDNVAINDGDFSIEFWFKPDLATWNSCLLELTDPSASVGGDKYFFIDGRNDRLRFYFESANDADVQVTATTNFTIGTWYHVACTGGFNRTGLHTLYINGVQVATSDRNTNGKPNDFSSSIQLGDNQSNYAVSSGAFDGEIDEFRIWSDLRTQAEIRDNMCQKIPGTEANLERYYRFDDGTGAAATDETGNQDATLTNMTIPADWNISGAPIGDESEHSYAVTTSTSLNIASADGDDLTANVTAIASAPNSVHIYRIDEEPNVTTPAGSQTQLSEATHYGVKVFGGSGVTYTVIYDYDGHGGILDENDLELAKRDDNADLTWTQESATLNTATNTLTLAGQTGTQFILASIGIDPLPIQLFSFTASITDKNLVLIEWQTASEINNDYFTIQRSFNGLEWEELKQMDGAGNSSVLLYYNTIDKSPYTGISYYRLKQTDFDGQFSYSKIRSVNIKILSNSTIEIFPNPTKSQLTIIGNKSEVEQIKVFNLLSQDVTNQTKQITSSESKHVIDLSGLGDGLYFIKTKNIANKVYKQ